MQDVQPAGDLPAAQPLGNRGEHLRLAPGDARVRQLPVHPGAVVPCHGVSVRQHRGAGGADVASARHAGAH
jgi:hypothetical protein